MSALVHALARLPRVVVALAVGLCLLAGLLTPPPWSALLLLPVIALMGVLTAAAWPLLLPAQRGLRVLVLVVLVLLTFTRIS